MSKLFSVSVKELKSTTLHRLASFEPLKENDQSNVKSKQFCRSTSENMHEYSPGYQYLRTLVADDTCPGSRMLNIHGKDLDTYPRRRIVSASDSQATIEDIYRRSVSAYAGGDDRNHMVKSEEEIPKKCKANIVEEEEIEEGSVSKINNLCFRI